MPAENGKPDNLATSVAEVSERVSILVREEIELAKAEISHKVTSMVRGAIAITAGAVFGIFALVYLLTSLAWGFDDIFVNGAGSLWIGFAIVFAILGALAVAAFLFAWRKLRVGAPTPTMAIDEAKKIRDTVQTKSGT